MAVFHVCLLTLLVTYTKGSYVFSNSIVAAGGDYNVSYNFNASADTLEFLVEVRATGWVGFGFALTAPNNMTNYDVAVGGVLGNGSGYLAITTSPTLYLVMNRNSMASQRTAFSHQISVVYRKDRIPFGDGVFIAVEDIYSSYPLNYDTNCEIGWASLQLPCQKKVLLASFYRSSHSSMETTMRFINSVNNVFSDQAPAAHVIFGGDFNLAGVEY